MKLKLTGREYEVLMWLRAGKSNWEIAQILGISERTVKFHVLNLFEKLGANNRMHAVSLAYESGLISQINTTTTLANGLPHKNDHEYPK